jgi:hypothetical protein
MKTYEVKIGRHNEISVFALDVQIPLGEEDNVWIGIRIEQGPDYGLKFLTRLWRGSYNVPLHDLKTGNVFVVGLKGKSHPRWEFRLIDMTRDTLTFASESDSKKADVKMAAAGDL